MIHGPRTVSYAGWMGNLPSTEKNVFNTRLALCIHMYHPCADVLPWQVGSAVWLIFSCACLALYKKEFWTTLEAWTILYLAGLGMGLELDMIYTPGSS